MYVYARKGQRLPVLRVDEGRPSAHHLHGTTPSTAKGGIELGTPNTVSSPRYANCRWEYPASSLACSAAAAPAPRYVDFRSIGYTGGEAAVTSAHGMTNAIGTIIRPLSVRTHIGLWRGSHASHRQSDDSLGESTVRRHHDSVDIGTCGAATELSASLYDDSHSIGSGTRHCCRPLL